MSEGTFFHVATQDTGNSCWDGGCFTRMGAGQAVIYSRATWTVIRPELYLFVYGLMAVHL